MEKRNNLFIICGPSGVGKGTLIGKLIQDFPDFVIPPSYTTRPRRPIEGAKKYHFVSNDEFKHVIQQGKILEYVKEHNYWFGTDKEAIEQALANHKTVILEIEPRGAQFIQKQYPTVKIIFIAPKSIEELEKRIRSDATRGKTIDEIELQLRMDEAKQEINYRDQADFVIVNENRKVDRAYQDLKKIFQSATIRM